MGGKFLESKWWQCSVVPLFCLKHYHQPDSGELHGRIPCSVGHLLTHCSLPGFLSCLAATLCLSQLKEAPETTGFLPSSGWDLPVAKLCLEAVCSFLPSYLPVYSSCSLLHVSMHGSHRHALCWAVISMLNYNWLSFWNFKGKRQGILSCCLFSDITVISI